MFRRVQLVDLLFTITYHDLTDLCQMTSLFSSFIIEPVIRQARGFSRSTTPSDAPRLNVFRYQLSLDHVATAGARPTIEEEAAERQLGQSDNEEGPRSRVVAVPGATWERSPESSSLIADDELEVGLEASYQSHSGPDGSPHGYSPMISRSLEGISVEPGEEESRDQAYRTSVSLNSTHSDLTASGSDASQDVAIAMSPARVTSRRGARQSRRSSVSGSNSRPRSNTLPEDDGMGDLRSRIRDIQEMDIPSTLKAKMMHGLMLEKYNQYHSALQTSHQLMPDSPRSTQSQDRSFTLPLVTSESEAPGDALLLVSSASGGENPYNVSANDLIPTYAPAATHLESDIPVSGIDDPATDTEPRVLGCQHYKRNVKLQCSICGRWYTCRFCHDDAEDHSLIRKDTKNMLCMLCGCAQPASDTSYKCPICSRSVVNMETQFRNLDRAIEGQPMPPQFQDTKALVSCNDCSAKSFTKYHWLGLKCDICHSYNTVQLQIFSGSDADRNNLLAVNDSRSNGTGTPRSRSSSRGQHLQAAVLGHHGSRPSLHAHARPSSSGVETGNGVRFPPYPLHYRTSRSTSPLRGVPLAEMEASDEDEEVDFWGGSSPWDQATEHNIDDGGGEDDDDGDEDDEEEDEEEDVEDDADDAEDIDIFGHR
ncbi:hypothetical protein GP486_000775 [Trichoglossum hirsutum]|uniref:CHY-type domain-containing protein n=1 Tax=Trichoglossum hirsutum TaxID=265104 RepID=A0A9P8LI97_9PEZI|nr:hypothetical protein GP486_000775 [Trichoglossum hirsutum]